MICGGESHSCSRVARKLSLYEWRQHSRLAQNDNQTVILDGVRSNFQNLFARFPCLMAQTNKKQKSSKESDSSIRQIVCTNRRARHEFDVLDEIDCGIVLTGSEVKSIRNNKISIEEAYARVDNSEVWLVDCDIAEYAQASIYNHARQRKRKLLMKRREIRKFAEGADNDGLTLVPLTVFFQRGLVKIRLGLCKGRKLHDKRQKLKEQDARREMREEKLR
jgi:SsrA-binding protein